MALHRGENHKREEKERAGDWGIYIGKEGMESMLFDNYKWWLMEVTVASRGQHWNWVVTREWKTPIDEEIRITVEDRIKLANAGC
ncbi:hypothetical protein V6N12_057172 [Hibiscus sabdariffa]|uniref:Uncharacterized protein n=1 Tax=Hibiscus sabdariffa TaxID=183260 RepID=A0ABR1ZTG3_9ROSI